MCCHLWTVKVLWQQGFELELSLCTWEYVPGHPYFHIESDEKLGGRWERGQHAHISPLDAWFVTHTWQTYTFNQRKYHGHILRASCVVRLITISAALTRARHTGGSHTLSRARVTQLKLALSGWAIYYQPAARFVRGRLVLRLLCRFCVCMCVRTYHVHNNYVTYIVAMQPYFSRLRQFRRLLCVAAMSSLPQLRLWDGYREAEAT